MPSHSQRYLNLSQTCIRKEFPQRENVIAISFAKPFETASESTRDTWFAAFSLRFGGQYFNSEFSGRVRIRIRIHSRIAATAVLSRLDPSTDTEGRKELLDLADTETFAALHACRH